jgi:anti-anti-sigma factor
MQRNYRQVSFERKQDVFCVRLRHNRLEEEEILVMAEELFSLIQDQGCRKMILCLGPGALDCLYSVFLATLVTVRRKLIDCGGVLKLCEVSPQTREVFEACHLHRYFDFEPDQAAAVRALSERAAKKGSDPLALA